MPKNFREIRELIRRKMRELVHLIRETCIIVVLLGAGGGGLERRREIAEKLEKERMMALIPEDDFPDAAPSLVEEAVLGEGDADLIFINVESWGTITEFAQFHDKENIAPKLRVLTLYKYHPLYGGSTSYLTDLYLTHMVKHGHVYAYDDSGGSVFPTTEKIIMTIAERYRELAALGKI